MVWVLANWKKVLSGLAILAVLAMAAFAWHTISGWKADSEAFSVCSASLEAQIAASKEEKEKADAYFKKLDGVERELARVKRVRPARCICPKARSSGSCNEDSGANDELHRANGVSTDDLYDFAGDAERVRVQLLACQDWLRN